MLAKPVTPDRLFELMAQVAATAASADDSPVPMAKLPQDVLAVLECALGLLGSVHAELVDDGTFVTTTYGHWTKGESPYVVSVRFKLAELDALPILARGAALRFLLTRLHDRLFPPEGVMVRHKDPLEFLRRLRFHRGIEGPGAYGLT